MHSLIYGRTASGKTYLARAIAWQAHRKGRRVIVLDSIGYGWPTRAYTDLDEFLYAAQQPENRQSLLVVDEGGSTVGKFTARGDWITSTSRHCGHRAIYICQSLTQASTTIRCNISTYYAFASSRRDCDRLADETPIDPELCAKIPQLDKGCFVMAPVFGPSALYRVEFSTGKIFKISS